MRSCRYPWTVERAITGFHPDGEGEWVAELACGHDQHVRHRPPFPVRAWVEAEGTRTERIGSTLACPLCERAEMPDGLRSVRTGPEWTDANVPGALLGAHRVGPGTWGRLRVLEGTLRFVLLTEPAYDVVLHPGTEAALPPEIPHYVTPLGPVRFAIDFLAVDGRSGRPPTTPDGDGRRHRPGPGASDGGGEPACWSGQVCVACGAVLDGGPHRPGCRVGSGG